MSRVTATVADGVGRITLAAPAPHERLDRAVAVELTNAVKRMDADGSVRVILLAGEGDAFGDGALAAAREAAVAAPDDVPALGRLFVVLRGLMKPVVAAVHGRAVGSGAALATACDVVLAAESAEFGYPDVHAGLVPGLALGILRRAVGEKRAAELVLTGRMIGALEAERVGLVSRVLPDEGFRSAATSVARAMAGAPELAMALTKRLLHHLDGLDFRASIAAGAATSAEPRASGQVDGSAARGGPGRTRP